jgi:hypothetical protein
MSRKHWLHLYLIYNSSSLYPLSIPPLVLGQAPKRTNNLHSPLLKMVQWPDLLVLELIYLLNQLNGQGQERGRVKLKY